jgi:hypothetical protein
MLCNYLIVMVRFHLEMAQHVYNKANLWPIIHQIHQGANQLPIHGWVYWIRVSQLLHIFHHGSFPWICNPSSQTSEEPFRYTSSITGNFHHDFVVHERLNSRLLESIQGLLLSPYMGLFIVYLKTLRLFYIFFFFNYFVEKNRLYIHMM